MTLGDGSPLDPDATVRAVNTFADQLGACLQAVRYRNTRDGGYEETPRRPREARLTVAPGITAAGGYFDVAWWENGDYKYHYREEGIQFRFGREAAKRGTDVPVRHFHPPNDLDSHEPSRIGGRTPELTTIGVVTTWFAAVAADDPTVVNDQSGLP